MSLGANKMDDTAPIGGFITSQVSLPNCSLITDPRLVVRLFRCDTEAE